MTKIVWIRFPIIYITRPNNIITTTKYPTPIKTDPGRSRTANVRNYILARYRETNQACTSNAIRSVIYFKYPESVRSGTG